MPSLETHPTPAQIVGRNIVIARKLAGMSQTQLAELVGVPRSYVSDWERGKHEPRSASFARIVEALERPRWWFYKDHAEDDDEAPAA